MDQVIEIKCEASQYIPIEEFTELQGNLKTLSEDNYVKLRNSITEFGFSFPVFYWQDADGRKWIIDAHQRFHTLKQMVQEGWIIPALPADRIHAQDIREARKKLLLLNSRYGKMTDEGLSEFLNVADQEINFEEIGDLLTLPDAHFNKLWSGSDKEETEKKVQQVTCPNCNHTFEIPQ